MKGTASLGQVGVDAFDFNKDMRPDVVGYNWDGRQVWYVKGKGDGTFEPPVLIDSLPSAGVGIAAPAGVVIHWDYIFKDSYGRGTVLKINLAHKFFQFIRPAKDYGIRKATFWLQRDRAIIIKHYDAELQLVTVAVDTQLDLCVVDAYDVQTGKRYFLVDKVGIE